MVSLMANGDGGFSETGGFADIQIPMDAYPEAKVTPIGAARKRHVPATLAEHAFWVRDAVLTCEIPYVVKGVIAKGQLVVIWGSPGSGKSFMVTDMLCHVGANQAWHGHRVQRGICIYVVAESSRVYIENRIAALRQERPDLKDADVLVVPVGLNLLDEAQGDVERVIATARQLAKDEGEVVLIAVDTLAVTFGGGDENSAQDMGRYVNSIKRIITETGAGVVLVHHSGKNELMRGSSALLGALDGELFVEGKPGDGERILKAGKLRDGTMAGSTVFGFKLRRVVIGQDQDGDDIGTCVLETLDELETKALANKTKAGALGKNQRTALRVLQESGGRMPRTNWAYVLKDREGMARNRVQEAIAALLDSGMVVADNSKDPAEAYIP